MKCLMPFFARHVGMFIPARTVPVGAGSSSDVTRITVLVTEQMRDAIVCAGDDKATTAGSHAFGAATAQSVAEHDDFGVGFHLDAVDRRLQLGTEHVGLIVQPLFENFNARDVGQPRAKCAISVSRTAQAMTAVRGRVLDIPFDMGLRLVAQMRKYSKRKTDVVVLSVWDCPRPRAATIEGLGWRWPLLPAAPTASW